MEVEVNTYNEEDNEDNNNQKLATSIMKGKLNIKTKLKNLSLWF